MKAFRTIAAAILLTANSASAHDSNDQSDLDAAWDRFIEAQMVALALAQQRAAESDDPKAFAQAYRHIIRQLVDAAVVSAQHDPLSPHFSRIVEPGGESGMDNPDTEYRMALIDGRESYEITGQLRSGRQMFIQSIGGQPGIGSAGPGDIIDTLSGDAIELSKDGRFRIVAQRSDAKTGSNWLKLEPRAGSVLVRFSDPSWQAEAASDWVRIERVCDVCPTPRQPVSPETAIAMLDRAAAAVHDRTRSWLDIAGRIWSNVPRNGFGPVRQTPNGLTGQYSAWGTFDLGKDEALVVTVPANDGPYQGIQLANRFFTSIEYRTRQSSLTRQQAHVDEDGVIRFVVSQRDPGVWNWLDPSENEEGLIMLRWQGAMTRPEPGPTAQLIKFDALEKVLPPSTRRASPETRRAQITKRIKAIDKRIQ